MELVGWTSEHTFANSTLLRLVLIRALGFKIKLWLCGRIVVFKSEMLSEHDEIHWSSTLSYTEVIWSFHHTNSQYKWIHESKFIYKIPYFEKSFHILLRRFSWQWNILAKISSAVAGIKKCAIIDLNSSAFEEKGFHILFRRFSYH